MTRSAPLAFLDALDALAQRASLGGDAPIWCPTCNERARFSPSQGFERAGACPGCGLRWALSSTDFAPRRCPPITMHIIDGSSLACSCGAQALADVGGLSCADCLAEELEEAAARASWHRCIFGEAEAAE